MTTKFNRSAICKQAWFNARCAARNTGASVRSGLSAGFKHAWAVAKLHAERFTAVRAMQAPAAPRAIVPAKRISAMPVSQFVEEPYSAEEIRRLRYIRLTTGCIVD